MPAAIIGYIRFRRQAGQKRLGLEPQREAIARFALPVVSSEASPQTDQACCVVAPVAGS